MSCSTLKSVMQYERHPSITAIQAAYQGRSFFSIIESFDVIQGIYSLSKKKAIHDDNITAKLLSENGNNFDTYISIFYKKLITSSKLPFFTKMANVTRFQETKLKVKIKILSQ